jgi:surface protein
VSKCTNFSGMFERNDAFNQPIGSWDVSSATDMSDMFTNSVFDQDIGSWSISNGTKLSDMFRASQFNNGGSPSISGWNVLNCNINSMFQGASKFNQPIGSWDMTGQTNLSSLFRDAYAFNQDIGSWDVSNVTSFANMFSSGSATRMEFNNGGSPSISGWNVSSCTNFNTMFRKSEFNQPIGSWDMTGGGGSVDISNMLRQCTEFDQSLAGWTISNISSANSFLNASQISTSNYDATLISWAGQAPNIPNGLAIDFGSSKYSASASASKDVLVNTYGWTITDGGMV